MLAGRGRLQRHGLDAACIVLLFGSPARAQEAAERLPPDPAPLASPQRCPVEGDRVTDGRFGALFKGRRYYTENAACLDAFLADPETYARELEPRAALFAPADPVRPAMGVSLLAVGVFFVFSLISAGVSSYVAVQKGLGGGKWFALGLVFNLLAIALVATRSRRETPFQSEGLTKVPATYAPEPCPGCGQLNHPSAGQCAACGGRLEPRVESEVARAGRS